MYKNAVHNADISKSLKNSFSHFLKKFTLYDSIFEEMKGVIVTNIF